MRRDFIYLASASPRRQALLEQIGVPFRVRPSEVGEDPNADEGPEDCVLRLARAKANAVWEAVADAEPRPVLAADTLVVLDGLALGKPRDARDAQDVLARLSGRDHRVLTAVAVRFGERADSRLSASEVRFRATTSEERFAYCETGEPMGKAGSYAIQGRGAVFVERLEGSFSCVVGLPLAETAALLQEFGLPTWLGAEQSGR